MTDNHTETLRESSSESPNTSAIVPDTRVSIKRDASQSGQPQSADYTQEIRFAVVMYGGVSLAVYINGVSQELLRMVRATAQIKADGNDAAGLAPIKADKLTRLREDSRRDPSPSNTQYGWVWVDDGREPTDMCHPRHPTTKRRLWQISRHTTRTRGRG